MDHVAVRRRYCGALRVIAITFKRLENEMFLRPEGTLVTLAGCRKRYAAGLEMQCPGGVLFQTGS